MPEGKIIKHHNSLQSINMDDVNGQIQGNEGDMGGTEDGNKEFSCEGGNGVVLEKGAEKETQI